MIGNNTTINGVNGVDRGRSMFQFDPFILVSMLLLMVLGVMFIYSSNITSGGELVSDQFVSQIVWIATGLVLYVILQFIDYGVLRRWSIHIYILVIVLLIITLLFGKRVNGAKSWIGVFGVGIQPSEFMKVAMSLLLASYYESRRNELHRLRVFLTGLGIMLVPVGFVLLQPDLGTALVYFPIFLGISYIAGVKKRYVFFMLSAGLLLIVFAALPVWSSYMGSADNQLINILDDRTLLLFTSGMMILAALLGGIGYWLTKKGYFMWISYGFSVLWSSLLGSFYFRMFLEDYQIMRLIVFLKPEVDPQGSGWNLIQSMTAVGSGGLTGKGFLQGTQSHYQFLPQQSTDFIYSIIAEEFGYLGTVAILGLFAILVFRSLFIALNAKDDFGVLVSCGVVVMIFFHVMINIGMAVGIMPVTGIPLFFLSYGGSSLWTGVIGLALIQNIYIHRYKY
jgi:rod shape determining protein RodA